MTDASLSSPQAPVRPRADTIHGHPTSTLAGLGLAALGIVFGDIGTSPLYTLKTVFSLTGGRPDPAAVLGVVSLIVWTLVIVTTLKYVAVAMSIDNDGEGGILALMSTVGLKKKRPLIVALGLFGAALIYGDGAVTPAISVLSALEGLKTATPAVESYVLPAAAAILFLLFAAQPLGTERIGKAFGPVMVAWFLALAALGLRGLAHHPAVLAAVNPAYAIAYLVGAGGKGFLVLGAVFLCATGAEALYADMGHFGRKPIRLAWLAIVFPCLLINYAGQAALVLDGASTATNIFYELCPAPLLVPLVVLATLATVIASQAIITGAFSMTRQAIQLGWLPRLAVKQTSAEGYGQIYVGGVNWLLMAATLALTLGFRSSDRLASAYGIAVSLTMLLTTALLFLAMREVLRWGVVAAALVTALFFVVDLTFFSANLVKVLDGGYVPLLLAALVFGTMGVWHLGSKAVARRLERDLVPVADFTAQAVAHETPRVPGTAVFLTRTDRDVPPAMVWHLQHNRALHTQLVVLTVDTALVPWTDEADRLSIKRVAPNFWRGVAKHGFMEHADIPALLETADHQGCTIDLSDVTFYVGHASITRAEAGDRLPWWLEGPYAFMERNSRHGAELLRLPPERTVEIGREVAI